MLSGDYHVIYLFYLLTKTLYFYLSLSYICDAFKPKELIQVQSQLPKKKKKKFKTSDL